LLFADLAHALCRSEVHWDRDDVIVVAGRFGIRKPEKPSSGPLDTDSKKAMAGFFNRARSQKRRGTANRAPESHSKRWASDDTKTEHHIDGKSRQDNLIKFLIVHVASPSTPQGSYNLSESPIQLAFGGSVS
jgi:hypothetical protein